MTMSMCVNRVLKMVNCLIVCVSLWLQLSMVYTLDIFEV